ncbi:MAG: gliding motility-associated C-terminal domain-containing protein, partial [Lacibacter sp.]
FSQNKKTEVRVEGIAPCRRFILSFNEVPLYQCNDLLTSHQIVFYESTGIIDVYVKERPACRNWNDGRAIIGIQNWNRDKGVSPPGRNAAVWSSSNEAWRFIPSSGTSLFKSVQLYSGSTLIATGDTSSTGTGELNANFSAICSTQPDSAVYRVIANYTSCSNPAEIISITDTIIVRRDVPFSVSADVTPAKCITNNTGSITVTNPVGPAYEYSIDSINWQNSNIFNAVAPGSKTIFARLKTGSFCFNKQTVNIPLEPSVLFSFSKTKTSCYGIADGTIAIKPSTGVRPFTYSINNGSTYQADSSFSVPAGIYHVYVKDATGCSKDSIIEVFQPDSISFKLSVNGAYCSGNKDGSIVINATGGTATFDYSLDGISYQASPSLPVTVGTYHVFARDKNLCVKDSVNIIVPLIDTMRLLSLPDTSVCRGTAIQFQPQTNATAFAWSPQSTLNNPSAMNPVAVPKDTTIYYLTAKLGSLCERRDTFTAHVKLPPLINAGTDTTICFGTTASLSATAVRGSAYSWSPSISVSNPNNSSTIASPFNSTKYTVTVTDIYGCGFTSQDNVLVNVKEPVITIAGRDTTAVIGSPVQLNGCCGLQYIWQPFYVFTDHLIKNPTGIFQSDTRVTLTTFRDDGCPGWDTIMVKAYKGPDIYVPTAFTPNNDGMNDQFVPVPVGITKMNYFRVYNRWGQLIYSGTAFMQGWDGTYNGFQQDSGNYTWMVSGIGIDGKTITKRGVVILIR